jgi:hypothetical protein
MFLVVSPGCNEALVYFFNRQRLAWLSFSFARPKSVAVAIASGFGGRASEDKLFWLLGDKQDDWFVQQAWFVQLNKRS